MHERRAERPLDGSAPVGGWLSRKDALATRLISGDDSNLEIELRGNHLAHPPDPLCPVENLFFGNVLFCSRRAWLTTVDKSWDERSLVPEL